MRRGLVGTVAAVVITAAVHVPGASAEALSPWWGVTSAAEPTSLVAGQTGQLVVRAENRGDASTDGEVTIVDRLPPGLRPVAIEGVAGSGGTANRGTVDCVLQTLTCAFSGSLRPYEQIEVDISVSVEAGASSAEQNTATVSGGGAAGSATASHAIEVNGDERFGVEDFQLLAEESGGSLDTRAGSHPFQLTSVVTLNTAPSEAGGGPRTVSPPKDLVSELPAGLLANPTPFAQCTEAQFNGQDSIEGHVVNECPAESALGVATLTFDAPGLGLKTARAPIFNMKPAPGEPARFGIRVLGAFSAFLGASIRSGEDYGVALASRNITEEAWLLSLKLTLWGVPGDPRHDSQRGWQCLEGFGTCSPQSEVGTPPFLSLPTSCGQPPTGTVVGDSWTQPEPGVPALLASYAMPPLAGCNQLAFEPQIKVSPDSREASRPSGLNLDVHVPQSDSANADGLAESSVKDIAVALPEGVAINPAAADGLAACSEPQVGFAGVEPVSGTNLAGGEELFTRETFCPNAAKIGVVNISTPLLANQLAGAVYLAAQGENPSGSLVALYIVAEDPTTGTLVKLAGDVSLDQQTGQIEVTFANTPQLPIEDIELSFFGGERAFLATPSHCGTFTTVATFTPWSGGAPVQSQASFQITSGPIMTTGLSGCPALPLPFAPSLAVGTTDNSAGSLSPLTVTVGREDGQQPLQGVRLRLPPGLEAMLSGVKLCPQAQAGEGTCPEASRVGETTVVAGVGGEPYTLTGGGVYLTEGYEGAPFGLAIVTPVKAGPLDLEDAPENRPPCDCLVIRARIEVDPRTAQLTIATGAIPQIIDGIPLQIKDLNITIDRAGFIFNPTDCAPMSLDGTITGGEGASAQVSSPFQVANCAALGFKPQFDLSTSGKTSRQNGASLHVKLVYPKAPSGQANLAAVKVDLPKRLVSRLATLQGACLAGVFDRDPAACPATSKVGTANASTPVLPVAPPGRDANLTGPAYFVSHGGKRFPELILVLQGDGVTVDLHGETLIDSAGITSSTFRTIPDVPVETFELNLPEGSGSALAANGKLCQAGRTVTVSKRVKIRVHGRVRTVTRRVKKKVGLVMPTALTAQNGAVIHQNTPISVTGCPPTRAKAKPAKKGKHKTKAKQKKK